VSHILLNESDDSVHKILNDSFTNQNQIQFSSSTQWLL